MGKGCDRGGAMIPRDLIDQFRKDHQFGPYIETSAHTGDGGDELAKAIVGHIDCGAIPYNVSPETFREVKQVIVRIKDRTYAKPNGEHGPTPAPVLVSDAAVAEMVSTLVRRVRKHIDEIGVIPEAEVLAGDLEYADVTRLPKEEEDRPAGDASDGR